MITNLINNGMILARGNDRTSIIKSDKEK